MTPPGAKVCPAIIESLDVSAVYVLPSNIMVGAMDPGVMVA